ncbi:MAG: GSU2403 family nucleotidyltransferase fold protein [Methylotenera sp.]|nr:GSU2403 family nucleotidyltransferase fold protein [Methylotenera sp.]
MKQLSDQQRLFLVESDQLYRIFREMVWRQNDYRYGMRWKNVNGNDYLVRLTSASGHGRSLGVRSESTEAIYQNFQEGRALALDKFSGLKDKLAIQTRLNRAMRLGRLPTVVAEILLKLDEVQALSEFRVVGTHALFAYEAMGAVEFKMELLASGDVDLLYDIRQHISIVAKKLDGHGLLGLLKKVDKTFEVKASERFRAVNKDGFMVDFITQDKGMSYVKPVAMSAGDLELVEVPNLEWLANSPRVESIVIASSGLPVLMPVPDPRAFSLHKAWLSQQADREPVKKQRDFNQAVMVLKLLQEYLPNFPIKPDEMRYFPKEVVQSSIASLTQGLSGLENA